MSLDDLVKEVVSNPWAFGMIPEVAPTHRVEDVTSISWYRQGQFQIQLFAMPPNCIVPEHTHTNVDSYEVMMGGRMLLSKHGRWVEDSDFEHLAINKEPFSRRRGSAIRVRPNDIHGGIAGRSGGVFMSVQKWLRGVKPHCVALDYKISNPRIELQSRYIKNGEKAKVHGHKGGRPKVIKELSKDAVMLNKLLKREISLREAADIMGLTIKSVTQIKSRYGLPRD